MFKYSAQNCVSRDIFAFSGKTRVVTSRNMKGGSTIGLPDTSTMSGFTHAIKVPPWSFTAGVATLARRILMIGGISTSPDPR